MITNTPIKSMTMNKTADYDMTIIIPVYNEECNLKRVEEQLSAYLGTSLVSCCVLFINDGSTDNSLSLMRDICLRHTSFFLLSSTENHGLSTALKMGIDAAESKWIGYIDSDLQTDPRDFNLLLHYAHEFQLVTGIRANRKDSAFKRFQSRVANAFRRFITGDQATDTGCPLKIMQTSYAKQLPFFDGMHRFLAALMPMVGGKMKEIPVRHYPRIAGQSKYHLWNRLKGPFLDCFAVRWMARRFITYTCTESSL